MYPPIWLSNIYNRLFLLIFLKIGKEPWGGGGGYMGYIGMCGPKGYGFSVLLVINRVTIDYSHFAAIVVINRVSIFAP